MLPDNAYPYWPPGSPQNPNEILQTGLERGLQDLMGVFIIPQYRETDVPIQRRVSMSKQITDSKATSPVYGVVDNQSLFDRYQASIAAPPASQVSTDG